MTNLNEEQEAILKAIPITEVGRYVDDARSIPITLQKVGIETLYDLYTTDIRQMKVPKGFSMKKSLELQERFIESIESVFHKEEPVLFSINEELKAALEAIPITEVGRYVADAGRIPITLQNVGIETLYDLYTTDIRQMKVPAGFSMERSLRLQKKFRELDTKIFDTILFFSKKYVFPFDYKPEDDLFENVDKVFKDLMWYLNECIERKDCVIVPNAYHNRVKDLYTSFEDIFINGKEMREVAKAWDCEYENIRQLVKVKFLTPLFKGEAVAANNKFLKDIELVDAMREAADGCLFRHFSSERPEPSLFVKYALNIDYVRLENGLGYITVPNETTLCYGTLYSVILDELSKVQKPISIEELLESIRENERTQRDIIGNGREFCDEFVYTAVYDTGLTSLDENKILIKQEYIVLQNRRLARIVADAGRPVTIQEIRNEYYNRYKEDSTGLPSNEYGCVANGNFWEYGVRRPGRQEWVEAYAKDKRIFYYDDIHRAITDDGYIINRGSLRTYITNCCSVDNNDTNHFCYRSAIQDYAGYNWADSPRTGIINWLANELKLFFEQEGEDRIHIRRIYEWLYKRGIGTEYEEENGNVYSNYIVNSIISSEQDSPFIIEPGNRGDWYLAKNIDVYNTIDWNNFAKRGREYEQKLIALATNIVRKSTLLKVPLMDIAREIYDGEYLDGWDVMKIRKKLIYFINDSQTRHALNLQKTDDRLIVSIDARRIDKVSGYKPVNQEVRIVYKTISQVAALDWDALRPVLYKELSFCSGWLKDDKQCDCDYEEAFIRFEELIKNSENRNLSTIFPQKIYEFFFVSDPTDNDRYLIMCSLAKNFEALLKEIHIKNGGYNRRCDGLYNLTVECCFDDFTDVLNSQTRIYDLPDGSYEKALKYLSIVRNTDAHGQWYTDDWSGDRRSESEKNIEKIRYFAALYIFAVAKYLY